LDWQATKAPTGKAVKEFRATEIYNTTRGFALELLVSATFSSQVSNGFDGEILLHQNLQNFGPWSALTHIY